MAVCNSSLGFTPACCQEMRGNGSLSCLGLNVGFKCELTMEVYFGNDFTTARWLFGGPLCLFLAVVCYRVLRFSLMPRCVRRNSFPSDSVFARSRKCRDKKVGLSHMEEIYIAFSVFCFSYLFIGLLFVVGYGVSTKVTKVVC